MTARRLIGIVTRSAFILFCCFSSGIQPAAAADLGKVSTFNIVAQQLPAALLKFAAQSGVQVTSPGQLIEGKKSSGVVGTFDAREALQRILRDTDLRFDVVNENTVVIMAIARPGLSGSGSSAAIQEADDAAIRLAQAETASGSNSPDSGQGSQGKEHAAPENSQDIQLEEILVTAQKRVQRLQDVPVPVTVINAQSLVNSNQQRLQEYYTTIPGLNFRVGDRGEPNVSIRGVTTGTGQNPTVGVVIDDVPIGSATLMGGGYQIPEVDPSELSRIEVLRGAQGTLYGASSLGGLIKYVTMEPSTEGVNGRFGMGVSSVDQGDELGYNVSGSVNVPLSDTWAIRASGFNRLDPGYIDVPAYLYDSASGKKDVNSVDTNGGRLSVLWRPSEVVSLKLGAMLQESKNNGAGVANDGDGLKEFQQLSLRGTGIFDSKKQFYNANLTVDLGRAELTSLTGYGVTKIHALLDNSGFNVFAPVIVDPADGPYGVVFPENIENKKFSQEVRLAMPLGQRVQWLFGAFYTHENNNFFQQYAVTNPVTTEAPGSLVDTNFPSLCEEYAAFTDLTFQVTDRFDVQVGGRQSRNRQTYSQTETGPIVIYLTGFQFAELIQENVHTKNSSFTYLVTPQFKVSPDLMVYARLASGYRPGGPNFFSSPNGVPVAYKPDTTQTYEIGVKGNVFNHALSFDASAYSIDWKDIQLAVRRLGNTFYVNAARARSKGIELSVEARPRRGMTIAGWVAWNDAELTEGFPADTLPLGIFGGPGDKLPFSSPYSANLSVDQEFSVPRNLTGFMGLSASYVGERKGNFRSGPDSPQPTSPSYTVVNDLHAGVRSDSWTLSLVVNNPANELGALTGDPDVTPLYSIPIRPRTIGLSAAKTF